MKVFKASTIKYILNAPKYQLEMMKKGQAINLVRLGFSKVYIFYTDEALKKVLLTDISSFEKGMALENVKKMLGDNILSSSGEEHLVRRKKLSKVFSKAFILRFEQEIDKLIKNQLSEIDKPLQVELEEYCSKISMDIISVILFGQKLEKEIDIVNKSLHQMLKILVYMTIPFYKYLLWIPIPLHRKYKKSLRNLNQVTADLIKRHKNSQNDNTGALDILIKEGLSDAEIKSQMLTLFLAGHETTATSLTWILYRTSEENLLDENVKNQFKECYVKNISYAEIISYPLVKAFIYEFMRLHPPVWNIGRKVSKEIEVSGVKLSPGEYLTLSPYVVHRDPSKFKDPDLFNLYRWINDDGTFRKTEVQDYFPFSHGSRNCIGKLLAETEIYIILKNIFNRIDIEILTKEKIEAKGQITLKPKQRISATLTLKK